LAAPCLDDKSRFKWWADILGRAGLSPGDQRVEVLVPIEPQHDVGRAEPAVDRTPIAAALARAQLAETAGRLALERLHVRRHQALAELAELVDRVQHRPALLLGLDRR
jgi:hypothetical protein